MHIVTLNVYENGKELFFTFVDSSPGLTGAEPCITDADQTTHSSRALKNDSKTLPLI